MRAHPVRFVDHDEIPVRLRQLRKQELVSRELVHPGDQQGMLIEYRAAERGLRELGSEDLEPEPELEEQLVLPLVDKPAGRNDQTPPHVFAEDAAP